MPFFSTHKWRLALLVGSLLALTVAANVIGWFATAALLRQGQTWHGQGGDYTRLLLETQVDILQTRRSEKDMLIRLNRPKALARARQHWEARSRKVSDGLQALGERAPEAAQRAQFKAAQQGFEAYRSGLGTVIEDITRGAFASAGTAERATHPHTAHLRAAEPPLEAALADALRRTQATAQQLDQVASLGPALLLATLALGALGGSLFSRAARRPVTQAAATPQVDTVADLAVHVHAGARNDRLTQAPGSQETGRRNADWRASIQQHASRLQQTAAGMEQTAPHPQQRAVPAGNTRTAAAS